MFSIQHLRLDDSELPSCDRTPPCSPFEIKNNNFCFRKGPDVSVVYQPKAHPKQAVIDGEIWPPIFKPSNVRSAKRLSPREEDVMIVTYPKCGTTWLQHICHQLLRKDECAEGKELCKVSPMIERMGGPYCDAMETPRILKTHFSRMNCPKNDKTKYIYAVRNPKDCAASYFHHNRNFKIYNWADGEWATFVDLFLSGQLAFGDYFDHLLGWIDHCRDENMLFLRYEDMLADLRGSIFKIGEFLGGVAAELVRDPDALDAVVRNSSIDAMKKDQGRWFPETQLKGDFIRKGGSRDWKNYFTKEQSDRMDALFRTRLAGTPAADWWYDEMRWEESESTCEEEQEEECEESVSRRGSFCSEASESRRGSCSSLAGGSVCSTGYGSVWTRLMKTRVQMRSIPAISINTQ